jgi:DNA-binding LytR/AlgR family response regulator
MNCLIVEDEEMSMTMIRHYIEKTNYLTLKHECNSAEEAANIIQADPEIDIVFLDVELPEMSGMDLLKLLDTSHTAVILTTSQMDYAVEAFEHNVVDYLVKPIKYPRFLKATARAKEILESRRNDEHPYLFVKSDGKIIKLNYEEIFYIEALSDYVIIHTEDKKFIVHSTMKGVLQKLSRTNKFHRVHRSYIINTSHITAIQDWYVMMHNKRVPIGRSYKTDFMNNLDVL